MIIPQTNLAITNDISIPDILLTLKTVGIAILAFLWNAFHAFAIWVQQPHIVAMIIAWWITFMIVMTLLLCIGFGPYGIVAGSLAAMFQSWAYGGFTPAGGIFAIMTSMAMLGSLNPMVALIAATAGSTVAGLVWILGVGR